MTLNKDLNYWQERTRRFGKSSVGIGCNDKLIFWDNFLRRSAISRLVKVEPGMQILDIGTGTGYWAIKYARAGAKVIGIDFNEDLLKMAEENARNANVKVEWRHASAEEYVFPLESFDVALSITCIQHITNRERQEKAVRNILNSLKPGGIFILLEDTVLGNETSSDYLLPYSQSGWIELIQSQGGIPLDVLGVSFLRFKFRPIPAFFLATTDYILSKLRLFKPSACVTAFSFTVKR